MLRPLRVPSGGGEIRGLGNWPLLVALIVGFVLSATLIVMVAGALGRQAAERLPEIAAAVIATGAIALLLVADRRWLGLRLPMLRRQTPKDLVGLPPLVRALVWGLDTGTMVSTFRTSGVTWAALLLALLGAAPAWAGAAYAAGFCLPLLAAVAGPAASGRHSYADAALPDGVCASQRLIARRPFVHLTCQGALLAALVLAGATAL
ncbi:MAG TPA: hypothetical protein VM266_14355 [Solirubrobacteraceae bacterium]|nr:hypothetical protein [Solirubrobacteraceae bacterium]